MDSAIYIKSILFEISFWATLKYSSNPIWRPKSKMAAKLPKIVSFWSSLCQIKSKRLLIMVFNGKMIPSFRNHDNTLFTFKSKMAAGLTPVWEKYYISCSGSDTFIMLESIHRFWETRNQFIHFLFECDNNKIKYYSKWLPPRGSNF